MDQAKLAVRLVTATHEERHQLLARNAELADAGLAWALKSYYDNVESSDVARAAQVSVALLSLADFKEDAEVAAVAAWVQGMVALDEGRMEAALVHLDRSESQFLALGQSLPAAFTQVSKFRAYALQGYYDEALQCGLRAREVFISHNDVLSIGKIEQNLGNLHFLLDRYVSAEKHYRAARQFYESAGDEKQLAQIDNCLAMTLTSQHRFREADVAFDRARSRAEASGLEITLAEIETNQGSLALYQGKYDRALDYLERARRRYAVLGMAHHSAIADQEVADAYLELNLAPEAAAIYKRVIPIFSEMGMAAEHARALAYHARARIAVGQFHDGRLMLAQARSLYEEAGNPVGKAMVTLIDAQAYYAQREFAKAAALAQETEAPFIEVRAWGRLLLARWLQAEAARVQGELAQAETLLQSILSESERLSVLPIIQQCNISLGLLAEARGDWPAAEAAFQRAMDSIENARAPLPAEEFRTAFLANKLVPYTEMVRLCLAEGSPGRVAEALGYIERARSRALLDTLDGAMQVSPEPRDAFEKGLLERLEILREELNWFYSQMNLPDGDPYARGTEALAKYNADIRKREVAISEITLQLRQLRKEAAPRSGSFDLSALLRDLGTETALVEYFSLNGRLLAFVLTNEGLEVIQLPETEGEVEKTLRKFHFQIGALRHGAATVREHLPELTARARHHLCRLYDLLMRPIENRLDARRLVVVPHGILHYVPFHALNDGAQYMIEKREICCTPSAAILHHCLAAPRHAFEHATLVGVSDWRSPRIVEEVQALATLFPHALTMLDEQASRTSFFEHAGSANVVHLACHGTFRMDNPSFSSLQLADGWLTVREVYRLNLTSCGLVTLSACETGINVLAPGDEWIGLARGFFSAGAPSLLVSQWIVDDEATASLMVDFYTDLRAGNSPAAALRYAQCKALQENPHPYFWAPFVILGRW
jgi:CHAT domain-containing protein